MNNTSDFCNIKFDCKYVYYDRLFDLNGTEKFVDISEEIEGLDFIDEVDLSLLEKYTDVDEISEKLKEYSVYESSNTVIAPSDAINQDEKPTDSNSKWLDVVTNEQDYEYLKSLPDLNLEYVAINSTNDDPDYFEFLYDNTGIRWIRFDKDCTAKQIINVIENMPNVEAVTFGFSEV